MSTQDNKEKSPARGTPRPEGQSFSKGTRKRGGKKTKAKQKHVPQPEPVATASPSQPNPQATTSAGPSADPVRESAGEQREQAAPAGGYGAIAGPSGIQWRGSAVRPEKLAAIFGQGSAGVLTEYGARPPSSSSISSATTVIPASSVEQRGASASGGGGGGTRIPGPAATGASGPPVASSATPAASVGNQQSQPAGGQPRGSVHGVGGGSPLNRGNKGSQRSYWGPPQPRNRPERSAAPRAWGGADFEERIRAYDRVSDMSVLKQDLTPEKIEEVVSRGVSEGESSAQQKLENMKTVASAQDRLVANQRDEILGLKKDNLKLTNERDESRKALKKCDGQDKEIKDLRARVAECEEELASNKDAQEIRDAGAAESERLNDELRRQLRTKDDQLSNLEDRNSSLEAELRRTAESGTAAEKRLEEMKVKDDRLSELEDKNSRLEADLKRANTSLAHATDENKGLRNGMSKKDKEIGKIREEVTGLQKAEDAYSKRVASLEKEKKELAEQLRTSPLAKENELLQAELDSHSESLSSVNRDLKDLEGELAAEIHDQKASDISQSPTGAITESEQAQRDSEDVQDDLPDDRKEIEKEPESASSASQVNEGRTHFAALERRVSSLPADLSRHRHVVSSYVQTDEIPTVAVGTQTSSQMKDAHVQTDHIVAAEDQRLRDFTLLSILIFFAMLLIWASKRDALRLWTHANDLSRASLLDQSPRSWTSFLWADKLAYSLVTSYQLNRGMLG